MFLGLLPQLFHFFKIGGLHRLPLFVEPPFHMPEPLTKLCVRPPQRQFRVHFQVSRDVDNHEEQVADFLFHPAGAIRGWQSPSSLNLLDLFLEFADQVVEPPPVKANLSRGFTDLAGLEHGRLRARNILEDGLAARCAMGAVEPFSPQP